MDIGTKGALFCAPYYFFDGTAETFGVPQISLSRYEDKRMIAIKRFAKKSS